MIILKTSNKPDFELIEYKDVLLSYKVNNLKSNNPSDYIDKISKIGLKLVILLVG